MPASAGPRSGQARTAITPAGTTAAAADSQATGRQRGDGSRPSGNSCRELVMVMAIPGRAVQVASQLESPTKGSDLATATQRVRDLRITLCRPGHRLVPSGQHGADPFRDRYGSAAVHRDAGAGSPSGGVAGGVGAALP